MLPTAHSPCSFRSLVVEAREPVPAKWFESYSFALVRRGVLIRQRADAQGQLTAVDALGTGAGFPLPKLSRGSALGASPAGYAATRTLLCLGRERIVCECANGGGSDAVDLLKLQQETVERLERLADARSRSTLAARIAALLCTLADCLNPAQSPVERLPAGILQRDLAALISARHESVCRVLKRMSQQGLIETGSAGICLLDRAALEHS